MLYFSERCDRERSGVCKQGSYPSRTLRRRDRVSVSHISSCVGTMPDLYRKEILVVPVLIRCQVSIHLCGEFDLSFPQYISAHNSGHL